MKRGRHKPLRILLDLGTVLSQGRKVKSNSSLNNKAFYYLTYLHMKLGVSELFQRCVKDLYSLCFFLPLTPPFCMCSLNLQLITSRSQDGCHHPGYCTLTPQHPKQGGRANPMATSLSATRQENFQE